MTTLLRWAPVRNLDHWDETVRDLFHEFGGGTTWTPAADVTESRDQYAVSLDLPGVPAGDVTLAVEDGILRVHGTRPAAQGDDTHVYLAGRPFGSFDRAFRLPGTVDAEQVKAAFKDGVLTVTLPKRAEAKSRRIEIAAA